MSITFPVDPPSVDTQAVATVGGVEKYATVDGTYISVLNVGSASITSLNADVINAGTLAAARMDVAYVYAGNITAAQIVSGTITVGGTNQITALTINESSITGNARLGWQHGSRMWEDSSSRLGINSIGSPMYIYINSSEQVIIPDGGQTTIRDGVYCDGNLNVIGDAAFAGYLTKSGTAANMAFDGEVIRFYNNTPTLEMSIHTEDGGKIYTVKNEINLGGNTLTLNGNVTLP